MNFKEYFDINPDIIQLNSGTLSIVPRAVKQAIRAYRDEFERNPAQGLFDTWNRLWANQVEFAKFVNANPKDIILRQNVTIAMNEFIMGVSLPTDGEILVSDLEYGAIANTCKYRAKRDGLKYREFHLPGTKAELENLTAGKLVDIVTSQLKPDTRLLMLSHVTTGSGLVLPITQIGKECSKRGIIFAVDGAHAPGAIKIDFSQIHCDFYGSNLHKWMMGPKGTGFGWFHSQIKESVTPQFAGWTTYETPKPFAGFGDGDRFAQKWMISSSFDFAPFFAISNMLKFWESVGPEKIWTQQKELGEHLLEQMADLVGWPSLTCSSKDLSGPLYAFELPQKYADMNFGFMDYMRTKHKVQIAVTNIQGKWHMRLAPQVYNTVDEIDTALTTLQGL